MSQPWDMWIYKLSRHFDLPCQMQEITQGRSTAYVQSRRLLINRHSPLGVPAVCLHEFAHLLAERRVPGQGHWHKTAFRAALLDCLDAVQYPRHEYPWSREYLSVRRWAHHRGHDVHHDCE